MWQSERPQPHIEMLWSQQCLVKYHCPSRVNYSRYTSFSYNIMEDWEGLGKRGLLFGKENIVEFIGESGRWRGNRPLIIIMTVTIWVSIIQLTFSTAFNRHYFIIPTVFLKKNPWNITRVQWESYLHLLTMRSKPYYEHLHECLQTFTYYSCCIHLNSCRTSPEYWISLKYFG